jgi:hypothetical protein
LALVRRNHRPGDQACAAERLSVLQVCVEGRNDDARVDSGEHIDTEQEDSRGIVDDDSLVEDAIEKIER